MNIFKPSIFNKDGKVLYSVHVQSLAGSSLWYSLDAQYSHFLTDSSDAPLVALLIPAMAYSEDIHIAGLISEKLYYNLAGPYQYLLQQVIPSLRRIKIFPSDTTSKKDRASGVATGFSCGIDSFCTLADHFYARVPISFKITQYTKQRAVKNAKYHE